MKLDNLIYILIMAAVTISLRVIPLTLIKKQITNKYIKSFLFYVPYVTLSLMTFPSIVNATQEPIAGAAALVVGCIVAFVGGGLFGTAFACCGVVLILEYILPMIG